VLSFLAFDFGTRRIGTAVGNTLLGSARPLRTIAATGDARFTAVEALIKEWQPDALVIGVPRHPDGAPHEMTALALRFGRQLHGRFRLAVHEVDERYSTTEAHAQGASDVDAASAAIILDQFLRSLAAPEATDASSKPATPDVPLDATPRAADSHSASRPTDPNDAP
jgi:putative Holliday junction resolvase